MVTYKDLIKSAKAIAEHISVSSVCPRLDNVKDTIEPFNVSLQVLCEQNGATFIDNTLILTFGDGTIHNGYLAAGKGPLLTKPGVNKLVRNLKMKLVNVERNITKAPGRHLHNNKAKPPTASRFNAKLLSIPNMLAVSGNGDNHIPQDNRQKQDSRWLHDNSTHTMECRVMILTTEVVVVYTVMNRVTTVPSVGIKVQ